MQCRDLAGLAWPGLAAEKWRASLLALYCQDSSIAIAVTNFLKIRCFVCTFMHVQNARSEGGSMCLVIIHFCLHHLLLWHYLATKL
jgi:hypothetical protein